MTKKILVIDDEPLLLKVVSVRLKRVGYEVFGGTNGQEALDLSRRIVPDLIILDLSLPDMRGEEVATLLKKDEKLKHIPIILFSAAAATIAQMAEECGADGYLAKPFEPEELISAVKTALEFSPLP